MINTRKIINSNIQYDINNKENENNRSTHLSLNPIAAINNLPDAKIICGLKPSNSQENALTTPLARRVKPHLRFSPDQRNFYLQECLKPHNSVLKVAQQYGISKRTLFSWQRKFFNHVNGNAPSPVPSPPQPPAIQRQLTGNNHALKVNPAGNDAERPFAPCDTCHTFMQYGISLSETLRLINCLRESGTGDLMNTEGDNLSLQRYFSMLTLIFALKKESDIIRPSLADMPTGPIIPAALDLSIKR